MIRMLEVNRLIKVKVLYDGNKAWTLRWGKQFHVFRGSIEQFTKLLIKIKAKDTQSQPNSFRGMKYSDIANEITNGKDSEIWVWERLLKKIK